MMSEFPRGVQVERAEYPSKFTEWAGRDTAIVAHRITWGVGCENGESGYVRDCSTFARLAPDFHRACWQSCQFDHSSRSSHSKHRSLSGPRFGAPDSLLKFDPTEAVGDF